MYILRSESLPICSAIVSKGKFKNKRTLLFWYYFLGDIFLSLTVWLGLTTFELNWMKFWFNYRPVTRSRSNFLDYSDILLSAYCFILLGERFFFYYDLIASYIMLGLIYMGIKNLSTCFFIFPCLSIENMFFFVNN